MAKGKTAVVVCMDEVSGGPASTKPKFIILLLQSYWVERQFPRQYKTWFSGKSDTKS